MAYRKEIDGLRAIAVVPVILFHAGFEFFSGGYVGVDIFFVISGFLITTILMRELDNGNFSVKKFYERRVRRLLPALFVVMLFTAIGGWYILMPSDFLDFCESVIAVIFCGSNFLFWSESGYWDTASELKPLLHTWSLAVEEQYYLLFPIFLLLFYRWSKKITLRLIIAMSLLSLSGAHVLLNYLPTANFFLLPSRAWELFIGSIAAFTLSSGNTTQQLKRSSKTCEFLSALGLVMILISIFGYDSYTPNPSAMMLLPTLGTFLILIFCSQSTYIGKILSWKPVVFIGLISYSAYLWHQPIFAYARYMAFPEQSKLLFGTLSLLVIPIAYLTWKFIENPFRNKDFLKPKLLFSLVTVCSGVFLAFGFMGVKTKGFAHRGQYQDLLIRNYEPDKVILLNESWAPLKALSRDPEYKRSGNLYDKELWFNLEDHRPKLLLVGNSHSKDLYNILSYSQKFNAKYQLARFGLEIQNAFKKETGLLNSPNYLNADHVMICSRYDRADTDMLESIVKRFLDDGKRVLIVRNIYEFETFGTHTLADKIFQKHAKKVADGKMEARKLASLINHEHYRVMNKRKLDPSVLKSQSKIDDIKKSYDVVVLDRTDYAVNHKNEVYYIINEDFQKFNYDGTHHTMAGAKFYASQVDKLHWIESFSY